MKRLLYLAAFVFSLASWLTADEVKVGLLDAPEVEPMCKCLRRIGIKFTEIGMPDKKILSALDIIIICGTNPPIASREERALEDFVKSGGALLGVGGGATWAIKHGFFDAKAYIMTGTTSHDVVIRAFHPLVFGYPLKGGKKWRIEGMLRATEGPFIEIGRQPSPVIFYDTRGIYAAAAFQRLGKGIVVLFGPDPQGGKLLRHPQKPEFVSGEKLKTDGLIANAIAFLSNPECNIVPDSGFERSAEGNGISPWQISLSGGAKMEWCSGDAPEGASYLRIICPTTRSVGTLRTALPLAVERGAKYCLNFKYRSSIAARVYPTFVKGKPDRLEQKDGRSTRVPPSDKWKDFHTTIAVPDDVTYVKPVLSATGQGEFCLDCFEVKPE